MDILKEVHDYVRAEFKVKEASIPPDQNILGCGVIDSMGLLKLVTFVEDRFDFETAEGDVTPGNFGTLERIRAYVERKTKR